MKNGIRTEIQQIQTKMLTEVIREFEEQLSYCQAVNGQQFEDLI